MWTCPKCGETNEDNFDACWNCGTGKDGSPATNPRAFEENPPPIGPAYEEKCPICASRSFSWGNVQDHSSLVYKGANASLAEKMLVIGGHPLSTRLCNLCGNLQLFVAEFLEQEPHV